VSLWREVMVARCAEDRAAIVAALVAAAVAADADANADGDADAEADAHADADRAWPSQAGPSTMFLFSLLPAVFSLKPLAVNPLDTSDMPTVRSTEEGTPCDALLSGGCAVGCGYHHEPGILSRRRRRQRR